MITWTDDFIGTVKISIVDLEHEYLVFSTQDPILTPIEGTKGAFLVDFCLLETGLEGDKPCLSDIAYGRLKIEETQSGKSTIVSLQMIEGKLSESVTFVDKYEPELTAEETAMFDQMLEDSRTKQVGGNTIEAVDGLFVQLGDDEKIEIRVVAADTEDESASFYAHVEQFDPNQLMIIRKGTVLLEQDAANPGTYISSGRFRGTGIFFFKAYRSDDHT